MHRAKIGPVEAFKGVPPGEGFPSPVFVCVRERKIIEMSAEM